MTYQSVTAPTMSGGLNLRDSPDQLSPDQAYDLLNVTFTAKGGVQSRPGYIHFGPSTDLTVATTVAAATITVTATSSFDTAGTLSIGTDTVTYTGKTATTFTGCSGITVVSAIGTSVQAATANRVDSMGSYYTGSAWQVCMGMGSRLETRSATGNLVGSAVTSGVNASPHYFAKYGGAVDSYMYAANGTDQVRRWSGASSTWTTPTWTITNSAPNPTGKFLAVTGWDNRLVNARYSSTTGGQNKSSVRFSLPLLPESWDGFNWVDLTPGDGEPIMGMASYGNNLIVFKQTKYFVFYGTGTSSAGTAEFQYRAVDAGVGLAAEGLYCVGNEGVYFVSRKGVFRTDGGAPELVSDILDPLFTNAISPLYGGTAINFASISSARMVEHRQQIFLAVPTGSSSYNDTVFVFDPRYSWWTRWDYPAASLLSVDVSGANDGPSLMFSLSTGNKTVEKVVPTAATDAGATYQSRIKFGYSDLGVPASKTIRESQIWGIGTMRFAMAKDFAGSANATQLTLGNLTDTWGDGDPASTDKWADGTNASDTWGGGQTGGVATSRNAVRALIFGVEIYSASTPVAWTVSKIIHRMREQRVPSVQKTDR